MYQSFFSCSSWSGHVFSLTSLFFRSSDEGMSGLGSPSDPCLSPLAWSVTGKYLACAMEKMVNIWQVNGKYKLGLFGVAGRWCSHMIIIEFIK